MVKKYTLMQKIYNDGGNASISVNVDNYEFEIAWVSLLNEQVVKINAFDDAFMALYLCSDLFNALSYARLDENGVLTVSEVCAILDMCGFVEDTQFYQE